MHELCILPALGHRKNKIFFEKYDSHKLQIEHNTSSVINTGVSYSPVTPSSSCVCRKMGF